MKRLILTGVMAAVAAAGATASANVIDACVGDSFVVEAPAGWAVTYTVPQFNGMPNMVAEGSVARQARKGGATGAVQWEVLPNHTLLSAPSLSDPIAEKATPKHVPSAYLEAVHAEPNRVTISARAHGQGLVRYFLHNLRTGEYKVEEFLVRPVQCGATTRVPNRGISDLCEGSVYFNAKASGLQSSQPGAVFVFQGSESGAEGIAGVKAGRSVLRDPAIHGPREGVFTRVSGVGQNRCPDDAPSLFPVGPQGREAFALELCTGEWWVSPSIAGASVDWVNAQGRTVFAEADAFGAGYGIFGLQPGRGTVFVEFDHPDARPLRIMVNVRQCSLDLTPLTLKP